MNNKVSICWYWLCPLLYFDSYSEDVALVEGIRLSLIPSTLRHYLDETEQAKYMAALPYIDANDTHELGKREDDRLFSLAVSLRLCHSGLVTPGPLRLAKFQDNAFSVSHWKDAPTTLQNIYTSVSQTSLVLFDLLWPPGYPTNYHLRRSDVPIVNSLITKIAHYNKTGTRLVLFEALQRFYSAYHGSPADRLIDQMIAFETLFIGDDKELGYKLALRACFLLGVCLSNTLGSAIEV